MSLRRLFGRFANVVRPGRAEPDLAREIASHLVLLEDEYQRRGMTSDAARREARLALGGIEQTKEAHRDARSFIWLDDARRDLVHAARLLRRNPVFATTAILSLAIGIGANTTIFTVVNALLFSKPAGVAAPNRLVDVGVSRNDQGFNPGSYPNYLDLRQRATTLDDVYATELVGEAMNLEDARGGSERIFGNLVTTNFFAALGAAPAAGRLFDARDERPVGSAVVVLSHRF